MWGVLGRVFGSPKAVTKIVNSVSSGLDKLVYTHEERAEDAYKERARARNEIVEWLKASQGQALARRVIAFIIVAVWAGSYMVSTGMVLAAVFTTSVYTEKLREGAELIDVSMDNIETYVLSVILFYFSANHIDSVTKIVMNRHKRMGDESAARDARRNAKSEDIERTGSSEQPRYTAGLEE